MRFGDYFDSVQTISFEKRSGRWIITHIEKANSGADLGLGRLRGGNALRAGGKQKQAQRQQDRKYPFHRFVLLCPWFLTGYPLRYSSCPI